MIIEGLIVIVDGENLCIIEMKFEGYFNKWGVDYDMKMRVGRIWKLWMLGDFLCGFYYVVVCFFCCYVFDFVS